MIGKVGVRGGGADAAAAVADTRRSVAGARPSSASSAWVGTDCARTNVVCCGLPQAVSTCTYYAWTLIIGDRMAGTEQQASTHCCNESSGVRVASDSHTHTTPVAANKPTN